MTQGHHLKEDYSKTNMEINVFFLITEQISNKHDPETGWQLRLPSGLLFSTDGNSSTVSQEEDRC